MVVKKVAPEERILHLLEKDREDLSRKVEEIRNKLDLFERVEKALVDEIRKERAKVELLVHQVERIADSSLRHLVWLQERNRIYKRNLEREIRKKASAFSETPEGNRGWWGLHAVNRVVMGTSLVSGTRDFHWEVASYAFLLDNVYKPALEGESMGYFLDAPLEQDRVNLLINQALELMPSFHSWEQYQLDIKDLWVELLLPSIYGGTDPYWVEGEVREREKAEQWEEDPIYLDVVRCISEGRRS